MFQVQVSFIAVWTLVLALGVLVGVRDGLADSWRRAARVGWEHPSAALLANDMQRLWLLVGQNGGMRIQLGVRCHIETSSSHILQPVRHCARS